MSKIIFLKEPSIIKDVSFSQIGKHQVRLIFNDEFSIPENDVLLSGFQLVNEYNHFVQTKREDYTYIYRRYDNPLMVELCNDGIEYVEPESPITDTPLLTPEKIETLFRQNKIDKINMSKTMLAEYLKNNPVHSSAHNGTDGVYSVTSEKQTFMMVQYIAYQVEKSINPNAKLKWNETGKSSEEWTEEEFLQLILEIKSYVSPLVSYQQRIEEQIANCTSQEELDEIVINYTTVNLRKK